jgi:hypothetical protein
MYIGDSAMDTYDGGATIAWFWTSSQSLTGGI